MPLAGVATSEEKSKPWVRTTYIYAYGVSAHDRLNCGRSGSIFGALISLSRTSLSSNTGGAYS